MMPVDGLDSGGTKQNHLRNRHHCSKMLEQQKEKKKLRDTQHWWNPSSIVNLSGSHESIFLKIVLKGGGHITFL